MADQDEFYPIAVLIDELKDEDVQVGSLLNAVSSQIILLTVVVVCHVLYSNRCA
jgi:hypothetical protein